MSNPRDDLPPELDRSEEIRRLDAALADREDRVRNLEARLASALDLLGQYEHIVGAGLLHGILRAKTVARLVTTRLAAPGSRRAHRLRRSRDLAVLAVTNPLAAIQTIRTRVAPRNLVRALPPTPEDDQYQRWLLTHEPSADRLTEMRQQNQRWSYRPLISVLVPVYNPQAPWLDAMVNSVLRQVYDNWELCLADDFSQAPDVRRALYAWTTRDPRIKVVFRDHNGNISAASNTALALATGQFVALVDHDDLLRPHALHRVVEMLQDDPETDLLYSDEDKILIGGRRGQVHFKGQFDPDHLLSTNYVSHLSVIRRAAVTAVGGFRTGLDGSQDHDLVLRVSERARRIQHAADVLYSWRQVPGSAALDHSQKPAAWEAGRRAVEDALGRRHTGGRAELGPSPGLYVARYPVSTAVRVTAAMMGSEVDIAAESLEALRRGPGLTPDRWVIWGYDRNLEELRESAVDVIVSDGGAHHARVLNELAAGDESDVLVLLAGDLVPKRAASAWLEPLVEQAMRDSVGAVGGRILGADGTPEQDGLHLGGPQLAESVGVRCPVIQQVAAVGADCMAVRRDQFMASGGFDERFRICLYDIDLCVRFRRAGLAIVYTPLAELRRLRPLGGSNRAADDSEQFRSIWEGRPELSDPFVSRWLESVVPLVIRDH